MCVVVMVEAFVTLERHTQILVANLIPVQTLNRKFSISMSGKIDKSISS